MKKKLLSLALVLVMALTLLPTAAFADEPEGEGETAPISTPAAAPETEEKQEPAPVTPAPEEKKDVTPEITPEATPVTPAPEEKKDPPPADTNSLPNLTAAPAANDASDGGTDPGPALIEDPPAGGGTPTTCGHSGTKWITTTDGKCQEVCIEDSCRLKDQTPTDHTPGAWATDETKHSRNCSKCGAELVAEAPHVYNQPDNKCVCGKVNPAPNSNPITDPNPTPTTPAAHEHKDHLHIVQQVDATCTKKGTQCYYECTFTDCDKKFSDDKATTEIPAPVEIPIDPNAHKLPASPVFTPADADETYHYFTCADCSKRVSESHNFSGNTCTVCSYTRRTTPSPYRYIDISSAYVSSYSFTVTWASDLPEGTRFDIYLDNTWQTNVSPSKSGNYFSTTVSTSSYLDDSYYYVAVYQYGDHTVGDSVKVYGRYYDRDHYYWDGYWEDGYWHPSYRPDYNTTPSTNSSGIPYASQVTGRYSASEAIRILRNTNSTRLQNELMSSSSARSSYDSLERAVKSANNVSVSVSTDRSGVPSALRAGSGVQISGAAFNASSTNSTVRLVVDAPSVSRYVGHGYQFSMSLTGVGNDSSLDVPVVVSMPLPSDINSNFVRVLHYHNSSVPTVITPQVSGGRIRFTLTGFSDFVITDNGVPYTYVSDGLGGYYFPVNQVVVDRRSLAEEPLSLSVVPTGYVYSDVTGTYWASNAIAWAQSSGLMTGYYDGSFRPYSGTTRQELWMVLARLSGASPATMQAAREWAMNAGITDGRSPEAPLSHQQMITMLYRYASYRGMNLTAPTTNLSLYRDSASVSPYARTPMAWAINRGIVNGNGTGYLNPQNIATRADFAVYLYRFVQ